MQRRGLDWTRRPGRNPLRRNSQNLVNVMKKEMMREKVAYSCIKYNLLYVMHK